MTIDIDGEILYVRAHDEIRFQLALIAAMTNIATIATLLVVFIFPLGAMQAYILGLNIEWLNAHNTSLVAFGGAGIAVILILIYSAVKEYEFALGKS